MKLQNKKLSIGVDIESIQRFRKVDYLKNKLFFNKIFTKNELKYCFSKGNAAVHLTARFAAKEAVTKALSEFKRGSTNYKQIEILNNENGAPLVKLNKKGFQNLKFSLSLSHCEDKAIAFAIIIER